MIIFEIIEIVALAFCILVSIVKANEHARKKDVCRTIVWSSVYLGSILWMILFTW